MALPFPLFSRSASTGYLFNKRARFDILLKWVFAVQLGTSQIGPLSAMRPDLDRTGFAMSLRGWLCMPIDLVVGVTIDLIQSRMKLSSLGKFLFSCGSPHQAFYLAIADLADTKEYAFRASRCVRARIAMRWLNRERMGHCGVGLVVGGEVGGADSEAKGGSCGGAGNCGWVGMDG